MFIIRKLYLLLALLTIIDDNRTFCERRGYSDGLPASSSLHSWPQISRSTVTPWASPVVGLQHGAACPGGLQSMADFWMTFWFIEYHIYLFVMFDSSSHSLFDLFLHEWFVLLVRIARSPSTQANLVEFVDIKAELWASTQSSWNRRRKAFSGISRWEYRGIMKGSF